MAFRPTNQQFVPHPAYRVQPEPEDAFPMLFNNQDMIPLTKNEALALGQIVPNPHNLVQRRVPLRPTHPAQPFPRLLDGRIYKTPKTSFGLRARLVKKKGNIRAPEEITKRQDISREVQLMNVRHAYEMEMYRVQEALERSSRDDKVSERLRRAYAHAGYAKLRLNMAEPGKHVTWPEQSPTGM